MVEPSLETKALEANLTDSQRELLVVLLEQFSCMFDGHLGRTSLTEHVIDTGDARPINLPPYRTSPAKKQLIEEQVQKILRPQEELKLYAPTALRGTLCGYYHDHPTAGHLGIAKTLARMQSRFYWPKMASEVKRYVLSCPVCQLTKPSQRKPAGFMVPISPQRPWEYAGVDFVGPLPRTASGNSYILVFVDYFSKWIEVCAVRDATARVAASKFINEVFARHGAPRYLISDRGSPFVSELFDSVLSTLGSTHPLVIVARESLCLVFCYTDLSDRLCYGLAVILHVLYCLLQALILFIDCTNAIR
uniref:Gypsy retrotransposon integrase-like protein 1 n=1 Tax=Maylandia zebra TaxID=106582 RepID=A0A3P9D155_9CICH